MVKFNREFNVGDMAMCKNGLTTVIRGIIDHEIFEQGQRYKIASINYINNQSYEYTITGENNIGIIFHQFFNTVDPNCYDVYEFFFTLAQERKQKLLQAESNFSHQENEQLFGWYWHDEINPDRDKKWLSRNSSW